MKKRSINKNVNKIIDKRTLRKIKKNVKGITLIALVVTIIVLLILAGVAISLTVGDNGLFRRAENAADTWQMAEQNEQKEMEQAGNFLDDYTSEYNKATTVSYAKQLNKPFENDTTIVDDLGNKVRIPAGFKIAQDSATVVEDGIVIEDKDGNQFVWIPARTEDEEGNEAGAIIKLSTGETATIVYKRTDFGKQYGSYNDYTDTISSDEEESVNEWGGYYIGRYEAGDKESTEAQTMRVGPTEDDRTITIKKNQAPYNWIKYDDLKRLSENMDEKQGYAGFTKLISGYAWDTAINFIQIKNSDYGTNSIEGNYYDTTFTYNDITGAEKNKSINSYVLVPTGQTSAVSNIYDMGGNAWEYIDERYNNQATPYTNRGGGCGVRCEEIPSGYRNIGDGIDGGYHSFRVALFL